MRMLISLLVLLACISAQTADYPEPTERDCVLRDFRFALGKSLPELRIHCRTLGEPRGDAHGVVRSADLVPRSVRTRGHGTHTLAAVWKVHLIRLLDESEP